MPTSKGFTLLELLTVLSLISILMAISSSFSHFLQRNQMTSLVHDFVTAINYMRTMAITRNQRITMCKSDAKIVPRKCTQDRGNSDWNQGWIIFVDINNDQQVNDADRQILRVADSIPSSLKLYGNGPVEDYLSYGGAGFSRTQTGAIQMGSFFLCNKSNANASSRHISISPSGRLKSAVINNKDIECSLPKE